jgi:hypothetical protein
MIDNNTPLGITQIYNPTTQTTEVSWSFLQDSDIEYFILEFWDDNKGAWVPYDGQYGIIKRQ